MALIAIFVAIAGACFALFILGRSILRSAEAATGRRQELLYFIGGLLMLGAGLAGLLALACGGAVSLFT